MPVFQTQGTVAMVFAFLFPAYAVYSTGGDGQSFFQGICLEREKSGCFGVLVFWCFGVFEHIALTQVGKNSKFFR